MKRLNTALREVLESTPVKARFYTLGSLISASTPEEFGRFLASEQGRWAATVKAAGIKRE